jgi:ABC-type sugar transport system ATPase subunit
MLRTPVPVIPAGSLPPRPGHPHTNRLDQAGPKAPLAQLLIQQVSKTYDGRTMAVRGLDLACEQGQMLALLGPSGCGKSSTLKMVAGIEAVTAGRILFDGVDVTALSSAARNVAMVFEDYALYPHLSVADNIGFPLKVRGVARAEIDRKVAEVVALLDLTKLLGEPVRALSGGAQQRVAIGRALVRDPALVMFDEPLSHLDGDQKVLLRTEIRRLQTTSGLTSVLVTHDQTEAMAMADCIAVMNDGELQQVGSPQSLYDHPANRFVAGFIGESPMNLFAAGVADNGCLRLGSAPTAWRSPWAVSPGELTLGIRPEHIEFAEADPSQAALALDTVVTDRECCGDRDLLRVRCDHGHFNVEHAAPSGLRAGHRLQARIPLDRLHAFDAATGLALQRCGEPA